MGVDLPPLALSVRQPWAWAIIEGGKDIENRSLPSIRAGKMDCRTICIHAATGMRRSEYEWAVVKMQKTETKVPRPDDLPRRAIIGVVDVVDIVNQSDSPWFGHSMGLVLANPRAIDPIPCQGALGYFKWSEDGALADTLPWMRKWDRTSNPKTPGLFPDMAPSFRRQPSPPFLRTPDGQTRSGTAR